MRGTAAAGTFIGWVSVAIGAMVMVIGYVADAAQASRALLVGTGAGCIALGVLFLLLSGILATLLDMREDAAKLLRAPTERPAHPAPARTETIGAPPAISMPSRYEMMMRHGEKPGGAAWDLIRAAAKEGRALPEAEALAELRRRG